MPWWTGGGASSSRRKKLRFIGPCLLYNIICSFMDKDNSPPHYYPTWPLQTNLLSRALSWKINGPKSEVVSQITICPYSCRPSRRCFAIRLRDTYSFRGLAKGFDMIIVSLTFHLYSCDILPELEYSYRHRGLADPLYSSGISLK
jgi:hypothetical protein